MNRIAALSLLALLASGCGNTRPGYEVLDFGDTGIDAPSDVTHDARRDTGVDATPDGMLDVAQDVSMDVAPDVIEDAAFSDAFINGDCSAGDAMACPATANANVTCEASRCVAHCRAGFADCNSVASDGCETNITDVSNCGTCGNVCTGGSAAHAMAACTAGACTITCRPGYSNCDGLDATGCEIGTQIDPTNCGTCGTICASVPNATAACALGVCTNPCNAGRSDCNATTVDGCETDTGGDLLNCGGCGHVCVSVPNANVACTSGTCTAICTAGHLDCDHVMTTGCEVTPATDLANCGTCGNVCRSGPNSTAQCTTGVCSITCAAGFADCNGNPSDGCEVALSTTVANCGTCGHACGGGANAVPACVGGACDLTCNVGYFDCNLSRVDGCEINTAADITNCGTCGTICTGATNATARCTAGSCTIACLPNYANCDGVTATGCEINTLISPTNCGTCGTVCPAAPHAQPTCSTGVCNIRCDANYLNCDGDTLNGCETMAPVCP